MPRTSRTPGRARRGIRYRRRRSTPHRPQDEQQRPPSQPRAGRNERQGNDRERLLPGGPQALLHVEQALAIEVVAAQPGGRAWLRLVGRAYARLVGVRPVVSHRSITRPLRPRRLPCMGNLDANQARLANSRSIAATETAYPPARALASGPSRGQQTPSMERRRWQPRLADAPFGLAPIGRWPRRPRPPSWHPSSTLIPSSSRSSRSNRSPCADTDLFLSTPGSARPIFVSVRESWVSGRRRGGRLCGRGGVARRAGRRRRAGDACDGAGRGHCAGHHRGAEHLGYVHGATSWVG